MTTFAIYGNFDRNCQIWQLFLLAHAMTRIVKFGKFKNKFNPPRMSVGTFPHDTSYLARFSMQKFVL